MECQHRIQAAWYNFHKYQKVLTNGSISIKLRMKLFEATVTPCILFGMSALPIYQCMMDKIDATRRKMLRKMVGWVRYPDEDWSLTMSRMNERVNRALVQWPNSKDWSIRIFSLQWQYACRVRSLPRHSWVVLACKWRPDKVVDHFSNVLPYCSRGGQLPRWDAKLAAFSICIFKCDWFNVALSSEWLSQRDTFFKWCV